VSNDERLAAIESELSGIGDVRDRPEDWAGLHARYESVRTGLEQSGIAVSDETEFEENHSLVYALSDPGAANPSALLLLSPIGRRAVLLAVPPIDARGAWSGAATIAGRDGPFGDRVSAVLERERVEFLHDEAMLATEVESRWGSPATGETIGRVPVFIPLFGDWFELRILADWYRTFRSG